MTAAMASSCDVSGAAHLPAHVALRFGGLGGAGSRRLFRLEGVAPSVEHRKDALAALLKPFGAVGIARRERIRARCGVRPRRRAVRGQRRVRRPAGVARFDAAGARLRARGADRAERADVLRLGRRADLDRAAARRRRAAPPWCAARSPRLGGHATLVRAPAAVRAAVDVFEPQPAALAALTKRVKESFDPKGVLNPGPHVGGGSDANQLSPSRSSPIRTSRSPTRSCAPACIAASAPRPARPMCCSATSSIRRAGAST